MGASNPGPEAGTKKPSITGYLNKTTLRLLEFLATDKEDRRYSLTEIAKALGVAPSTISRAYRPLLEVGILLEYDWPRGNTGRPITVIGLDEDNVMVDVLVRWIRAFRDYLCKMQEST